MKQGKLYIHSPRMWTYIGMNQFRVYLNGQNISAAIAQLTNARLSLIGLEESGYMAVEDNSCRVEGCESFNFSDLTDFIGDLLPELYIDSVVEIQGEPYPKER